jgi:flagellar biosynthesis protein FlhG
MRDELTILDQATNLRRLACSSKRAVSGWQPSLVTITSGKGGVGKSTVALSLAKKLSELGENILLVDADANLGNLDVMLGVSPRYRISDVLKQELDIEDALIQPSVRLKFLAGTSGATDYPLIGQEEQSRFLKALRSTEERFDMVILDTAAGLTREIVNTIIHSTEVVVVTNPEPTSVMDAYAVMKVVWASNSGIPMSFLMNAVRVPAQADEAAEKLQLALNHFLKSKATYLGAIPFDDHVSKAVVRQTPVVDCYPSSAVSLSMQALAQMFVRGSASCRIASREAAV